MDCKLNENIEEGLSRLSPASLKDINRLNILNRYDTKLVANQVVIPDLLQKFSPDYKVLEIENKRIFNYSSCYYDTNDFLFYNLHHNGNSSRLKVRNRMYVDSDLCFLEIKQKDHHSMTLKNRLSVNWHDSTTPLEASDFLMEQAELDAKLLSKKLIVEYRRITLLNEQIKEKITIDMDICYKSDNDIINIVGVSLIELKHKSFCKQSTGFDILKSMSIKPLDSFSKYCVGLILTNHAVKYNRFKSQLLSLNKISGR